MAASLPRPRKRLGQHFLVDQNIARKILDLAAVRPDETVLEIGPGRGVLTGPLCDRATRVIAIEIDPDLHHHLQATLSDRPALDLRRGDALGFPFETLPEGTVVVANLPYYLSTPLLFGLLGARERLSRLVVMVQTEVARRIVAGPGTGDYGVLSVLLQCWTIPKLAFRVPPTCFRPRPEVGSSVLSLRIRPEPAAPIADRPHFTRVVRAAFAHRRKTVSNSLRDEGFPQGAVQAALAEVPVAPHRRAETLSLQEFAALAEALRSRVQPADNSS